MNALAKAVGREVAEGMAPDLVAITGDLVFSGKAAEYERARRWLEGRLWPKLGGLGKDRLLLVPGNRDVDRGSVKRSAAPFHADPRSSRTVCSQNRRCQTPRHR